jgi:hypothetical protein
MLMRILEKIFCIFWFARNYTSKSGYLSKKTEDPRVILHTTCGLKYAKKDFNLEMFNALEFIKATFLVSK